MSAPPGLSDTIRRDLQPLSDHAVFEELSPAISHLPPPPHFHFGTFPADLARFYYGFGRLGPAGVWYSDALTLSPNLLLSTSAGALVVAPPLNWLEGDIESALARGGAPQGPAQGSPQGGGEPLAGDTVLMVTPGYPIYGHWLADILPRLVLLQRAGHVLEELTFLVPEVMPPFARHLLEMLGIEERQLHPLTGPVRPRRLLMPTFPHNGRQFMALAGDGFRLLRSRIEARSGRLQAGDTPGRVLVSRGSSGNRRLSNRAEFEALAVEHGFVAVAPQSLSFFDQVRLFAGAEAVLGEYGSGLHNSVFSPAGTVVCAVRGTLRHPAFIQSGIGDALGQPTGYVFGTSGDHIDHPDFHVEPDAVRDCLRAVFPKVAHRVGVRPAALAAEVRVVPRPALADPIEAFRHAVSDGRPEAAVAAAHLLTADGEDQHGVSAEAAELCARLGEAAEAARYAVAALSAAPGDVGIRRLLARLLPAVAGAAPSEPVRTQLRLGFQDGGNAAPLLGRGWSRHAPRHRWMLNDVSTLALPELDAACDWIAELDVFPFVLPCRLRILLDWVELRRVRFTAQPDAPVCFLIPAEALAGIRPHTITFDHPDTGTFRLVDGRDDDRALGFGARSLVLKPAGLDAARKVLDAAVHS